MRPGEIRHRALLSDLSAIAGIDIITTRDARLPKMDLCLSPTGAAVVIPVRNGFESYFTDCMEQADAVWLIAPESDDILENLSRQILSHNRILLGSTPAAIHIAASKLRTVRALAEAGIPVVETYTPEDVLPQHIAASAWVVKPDKGAGCRNSRIFSSPPKALAWIAANSDDNFILQPFMSGQPCSLCLICCNGVARVLSCNKQRIAVRDNQLYFLGSTINSFVDVTGDLDRLAQDIAAAIPGLWGYVGVDFIFTDTGPVVLEVNPQMTSSCAGLHASIDCNPAELVLGLLHETGMGSLLEKTLKATSVSIDVATFDTLQ